MLLYILSFGVSLVFWLWIIRKYDKFEKEPLLNILFVFLAGGILSIIPAGVMNLIVGEILQYSLSSENEAGYGISKILAFYGFVGINEEFWKATATVLLIRKMKQFNEPADALVYSMSAAFGFAFFENIDYTDKFGLSVFFVRQATAVPLHVGLAAIWGIGIAKSKFQVHQKYRITLVQYVLLAALIHAVYNLSIVMVNDGLLNLVIPVVISLFLIRMAINRIKKYSEESPFSKRLICHNCHTENFTFARKCRICGQLLILEFYNLCNVCNTPNPKNEKVCMTCGNELEG